MTEYFQGLIMKLSTSFLITTACAVSLLTACSDDSPSYGIPYNQIPADAVVITDSNAVAVAGEGHDATTDDTFVKSGVDPVYATISSKAKADLFLKQSPFGRNKNTDIPAGVTGEIIMECDSGRIVLTMNSQTSGSMTFQSCRYGTTTANGRFDVTETYNLSTMLYTSTLEGGISISDSSFTISMGINSTEIYSENSPFPYSLDMDYAISGIPVIGGFQFETVENITGTLDPYPVSGVVIISGADNTRLRITFNNNFSMSLEIDNGSGVFVPYANNPVYY